MKNEHCHGRSMLFTGRILLQTWPCPCVSSPCFPIVYPLLAASQACVDINASTMLHYDNGNWQLISWVCLHPIPNSFLPRKASLVRMRSWINYKYPILIQWLPAMLRCVAVPCLNYVWTRFCKSCSCVRAPRLTIKPKVSDNTDNSTHIYI